jgi:hypothetical protein
MSQFKRISDYCLYLDRFIGRELELMIDRGLNEAVSGAKKTVIDNGRVKTGLMLRSITGKTKYEKYKKTIEMVCNPEVDGKRYASYQEYGTKRGIKGILFMSTNWDDMIAKLDKELEDRLDEQ